MILTRKAENRSTAKSKIYLGRLLRLPVRRFSTTEFDLPVRDLKVEILDRYGILL